MYKNDMIFERLRMATHEELIGICMDLKMSYSQSFSIDEISKEYRAAAGHSILNFSRSAHALPYKRILIDVADKLKDGLFWTDFKMDDQYSEIDIEEKIAEYANYHLEKAYEKMSPAEREKAGIALEEKMKKIGANQNTINAAIAAFTSGSIGAALAIPAATAIFYTSSELLLFSAVGVAVVPSTLQLLLTGTGVGLAVAAPLLAVTLGGPAYRKIVPVTMRMIAIRKRLESKMLN